jgi:hypothetical protein
MPDEQDKQDRRDDTELRRTDTGQRAADTEQRAADTEQRALDSNLRSEDAAGRRADRETDRAQRDVDAGRIAGLAAVEVEQAEQRAEQRAQITKAQIADLIEDAQRKRRRQALVLYALVTFGLILGFWRAELADNRIEAANARIERNSANIQRIFQQQCELLREGFTKVNGANDDIVLLLRGSLPTSANPAAIQRLIDDFNAKKLPIPDCNGSLTAELSRPTGG